MIRVPKEYRKQADFANYLILVIAVVSVAIIYAERISSLVAWIISVLFPFILGLGMAFVFNIIAKALLNVCNRLFKIKYTKKEIFFANIASIILVSGVVLAFVMMVFPQLFTSLNSLVNNLPSIIDNLKTTLIKASSYLPFLSGIVDNLDIQSISNSQIVSNLESISNVVLGSTKLMDQVNGIISTTISWFTTFILAFVFSVFILLNKEKFMSDVRLIAQGYMPKKGYKQASHVYHTFTNTFGKYIGGTILECIILGTLVFIACTLLNLPYPLLAAFIVAFGALVPMFGALVSAIIVTLFMALQGNVSQAVTFIVVFILIQQVEGNFIYPNVVGRSIGLPPMYVIVAVTLGASLGGVLGMIVFIPLFTSVYQLVLESAQNRLKNQQFKSS